MQANKVWPVKLQEQPLAEQSITSTVFLWHQHGHNTQIQATHQRNTLSRAIDACSQTIRKLSLSQGDPILRDVMQAGH